nr:CMRF35-like molecule 2 [Mirounga angustirostris]
MWLPPFLLLLCLSGSLSLTGPSSVTGTLGGSLSVPCQYEEGYQRHNKYWCRGEFGITCEKIVETKGEEKEERNGRVSIRDHADNFTFIVTMENLTTDDAGSYWCRIQRTWLPDPLVQVNVSVSAGKKFSHSGSEADGSCLWVLSSPPSQWCWEEPMMRAGAENKGQGFKSQSTGIGWETSVLGLPLRSQSFPVPMSPHRSLLSSVHFLLLVFLKLPLFLTLVGAVLWVNRPQRGCGGNKPNEDNPQWYTVPRNGLSRNVALQTGQERPSDSGLQGRGAAVPGFWTDPGLFEGIVPVS